jgi:hypothetical protein
MALIRIQDLIAADLSDTTFGDVKTYSSGAKFVPLTPALSLQLPSMCAPFGISQFSNESKKTIALNVTDPEVAAGLTLIDDHCRKAVTENPDWLGKKAVSSDYAEAVYGPLLKPATNPQYSATTKLSLKMNDAGAPDFLVSGASAGLVKDRYKRHQMKSIVAVTGLWIASGRIGVSTRLHRLLIEPPLAQNVQAPVVEDALDFIE